MKRADRTIASTLALSLALSGPLSAQQMSPGAADLPEAAQERLDEIVAACEETGTVPEDLPEDLPVDLANVLSELDCDAILEMEEAGTLSGAGNAGNAEAQTEADAKAEAAAQAETATQAETQADAETEAQTETDTEAQTETDTEAQIEANTEAQTEADTGAQTDSDAQADAEAQAETGTDAEAGEVSEDDLQRALESGGDAIFNRSTGTDDAAQADAEAEETVDAEADAATETETDAQAATDEPETTSGPEDIAPIDPQEQADAVAADEQESAAAAASDETGEAEMTEEVVGEEDVRQSSEDFTAFGEAAAARAAARDGDDDDDDNNTLRNVALLGLGAVALSEILRGNERVVSNSGDRVVIEDQGQLRVLRNDDVLLRRPGAEVQTFSYNDGSTRQVITYDDGTTVETVRAADGRVLRRTRTLSDGTEIVLFDDTQQSQNVDISQLPQVDAGPRYNFRDVSEDELVAALGATAPQGINRIFSLNQIRNIDAVRELVPEIAVDTINFETGSAAIRPTEAQELATLGNAMRRIIENDPDEVFLIEGHTDAVGSAGYNLALSDRRAESVALALTEYFNVPPSNMVLQGYGESDLMVETQGPEVRNRRAAVRRITPLLR